MPATTTTKVEATAVRPGGMTLDEIGRFVQEAMRAGATGDERPIVRVRLNGTAKTMTLTLTGEPAGG